MKKKYFLLFLIVAVVLVTLVACSSLKTKSSVTQSIQNEVAAAFSALPEAKDVKLDQNAKVVSLSVANEQTEITLSSIRLATASYVMYADEGRTTAITDKLSLAEGENLFYMTAKSDGISVDITIKITREEPEPEPPHNHYFVSVAAKAATCTEDGVVAHFYCKDCGAYFNKKYQETTVDQVTIPALGHDYAVTEVIEATCTEKGYTLYTCSRCADSYHDDETEALGHILEHHEGKDATCLEGGWAAYDTCARCDYTSYADLAALGHDLEHHDAKAATCTESGWKAYVLCARCGYTTYEELEALGHDYGAEITAPTCTTGGYTTHTCSRCADSYVDEECAPLGHHYVDEITAPTCTEGGYTTHTCSRCADVYVDSETAARGHDPIYHARKAATCTEIGWTAYDTCTRCDYTTYTELAPLGHDYHPIVTPPSCTTAGYTTHICSRCGDDYVDEETQPIGHDYHAVITDPTCTEGGYTTHTCSHCGHSYVNWETPALGHDLIHHDARAESCTEIGWAAYDTCTRCDYTTYREIEAYGHDYQEVVTPATCTEPGYAAEYCTHCGEENPAVPGTTIPATGHRWEGDVCSVCGIAKADVDCNVYGHDYYEINTPATCEEAGLEGYRYCIVCGYVEDEGEVLPALGHDYLFAAFVWTETFSAQAKYVCTHDSTHVLYFDAIVASEETSEPGCEETGLRVYHASYDQEEDFVEEILAALGHDYDAVITAPTCTTGGYTTHTCSRCGDVCVDSETAALGHDLIHHDGKAATCFEGGWAAYDTCSRCDYTTYASIEALGHAYDAVEVAATCTANGYTLHTCAHCGDSYIDNETNMLGHDIVHYASKAASCTEIGWKAYDACTRCDYSTYKEIAALGHAYDPAVVTAPTCTQGGYTTHSCRYCDYSYIDEETPALGHDLTHYDAAEASCTEAGHNAYDACSRCDYTTRVDTPALGHHYVAIVHEPNCIEDGYTEHTCSRCQDSYNDTYVGFLGHNYQAEVVAPTCTEGGYTLHRCSRCGDSERSNETSALGHDLIHHDGKEATCYENGYTAYDTCARCDYTTYEEIEMTGHTPGDLIVTKQPTCTESGSGHRVCSVCSAELDSEEIQPTGHIESDWIYNVPPTCTDGGSRYKICTICETELANEDVEALGHDYEAVETSASCTEGGYTTYTCTRCGDSYTDEATAVLGHNYEAVVTAPTCTEAGYTTYTCSRCEDRYVGDEVAALGHDYLFDSILWAEDHSAQARYVCSHDASHVADYAATVTCETTKTVTCTEGGVMTYTATYEGHTDSKVENVAALGHDLVHHAAQAATCEMIGWDAYDTCTRCDYTTYEEIDSLGHTFSPYETVKQPTCEEKGEKRTVCTRCNFVVTEEIAALGHDYFTTVTAPNCTEQGYTTHTCSRCGQSWVDTFVEPIGHDYSVVTVDPTCTEGGYTTHTCARCDDSYTDSETIALGHLWGAGTVTTQPTTSTTGEMTYVCSRCTEHKTELIPCTPVLTAGDSSLTWNEPTGATSFLVSTDGGSNWTSTTNRSVSFSATTGAHTIKVKSKRGDITGNEASYSYETKTLTLSALSKSGRTVTWTATARSVSLTVNNASANYTLNNGTYSYTCPATQGNYALTVTVTGGFDSNAGVYYAGSVQPKNTAVVVKKLSAPTLTGSDSGVSWDAVTDAVSYSVSLDNGSASSTTERSVSLNASAGNHTVAVKAVGSDSSYLDSDVASYTYETKIAALSNLTNNGRIISWTATAHNSAMTIYLNNVSKGTASNCENLTSDSGNYTYSGVPREEGTFTVRVVVSSYWDGTNRVYYYIAGTLDKSKSVTISKLSTPTITMGASSMTVSSVSNADHYVDGDSKTLSSRTVSYATSTGSHSFKVKAIADANSRYIDSDYSSTKSYYTTPIAMSDITFAGLTAKWTASARRTEVKEDDGEFTDTDLRTYELQNLTAGSHSVSVMAYAGYDSTTGIYYSGNDVTKTASKTIARANTTLTFEDQTADKPYTTANGSTQAQYWTQQYWNPSTEGWVTTSNQMNSRYGDTSRVVNFSSSTTKGRFTYSTGSSLGVANTFSVRLGNYYTAYDIWYKIMLIDTSGNTHYLAGATNKSVQFPSTGTNNENKVFTTFSITGFDPIEVSAIKFEVYGSTNSSSTYCYFYVDDITLKYVAPELSTAAKYTAGSFTVSSGGSSTKSFSTAGYADALTFKLKNSSGSTAYSDVTVYNENYAVAAGRYVLYGGQENTYTLIFNKWKVTKFTVTANGAAIEVSSVSPGTSNAYAITDHEEYRVTTASGDTSILLMGEEVKSTKEISYNLTAIRQLQRYAADVSPLFGAIVNVKEILSASYSQNVDVMSNASYSGTFGTLTIKYIENGSNSLTTSTITVKKKASASLNEATRDCYSRNLWKEISIDPHEVVLAGSSSMEKWESVGMDMKGITFADVGIGGTVSTDWSMDGGLAERLIYAYNPRAVILFVGVNDLKGGKTVANTLTDVQTLLTQIHNKLPNAKIYYVLINKVPLAISKSQQLTEANVETFNNDMVTYANNRNWLTTIALDTSNHMVYAGSNGYDFNYNSNTNAYVKTNYYGKSSFFDSMHLNKAGYTEWAYAIRKKFLALDKKATWSKTD